MRPFRKYASRFLWPFLGALAFLSAESVCDLMQPTLMSKVVDEGVARGELYRDISTYCGLGEVAPHGSVVRAAASPIVNILGGGGLAPVVPEDVYRRLQ